MRSFFSVCSVVRCQSLIGRSLIVRTLIRVFIKFVLDRFRMFL